MSILLHEKFWKVLILKTTLPNKHQINRLTLSKDYIPQKSFKSFGLWSPKRYEIDLSNEALNIDFG